MKILTSTTTILIVCALSIDARQPHRPYRPSIRNVNSNSNRNVNINTNNNGDSLYASLVSQLFGNQNIQDPDRYPCPYGQPCYGKSLEESDPITGIEDGFAETRLDDEVVEENVGSEIVTEDSGVDKQRVDYIFTYRAKQDNGRPVCGTVQKDVRGTFRNGLGKWGNEVVATFTITSFGRDERSRTIVRNTQARIDLQGMFTQYGKRWANLQIQWNGVHPSPTTFGSVFLQAEKTFPIRLVRNAFVQSMLRCAKVWLEVSPRAGVPQDRSQDNSD